MSQYQSASMQTHISVKQKKYFYIYFAEEM